MKKPWVVWPSPNLERSRRMVEVWREFGARVAVLLNPPHKHTDLPEADMVIVQEGWSGFPVAANLLCHEVPGDIVVVVGDDIYPDPSWTAQGVGQEMLQRFPGLEGVMQPIGDEYGWTHKCAGSPWIGRGFIEKAYGGVAGPFWPGYFHYFCDQELQEYATSLGVFQQRPDLTQFHDHWQRKKDGKRPKYLRKAKQHWAKDRALFNARKREKWPWGSLVSK